MKVNLCLTGVNPVVFATQRNATPGRGGRASQCFHHGAFIHSFIHWWVECKAVTAHLGRVEQAMGHFQPIAEQQGAVG